MATLFCPRSATACFRRFPHAASPIVARAAFSEKASGRPWTPEHDELLPRSTGSALSPVRSSAAAGDMRQSEKMCSRGLTFGEMRRKLPSSSSRAAYSTRTWSPEDQQPFRQRQPQRPSFNDIATSFRKHNQHEARHASTIASSSGSGANELLTWDRFFKLRRNRRWINAGCSLVTAAASVLIFAPILAQQDFDTWGAQVSGLDPVIVLGISTFGIAAVGWLMGPTLGNGGFRIWAGRKGWTREIAIKEKSFYARIKKYRADASSSSPQNPIPDYYGEKVASVKDYRRWLKDQRAFNLKKNKNMI